MPDQLRQNFHNGGLGDPVRVWQSAPTALAVVGPDGAVTWNAACEDLLQEYGAESTVANRNWLAAAAVRLLASGQPSEVLYPGKSERGLVVAANELGRATGQWVVSLVPAAPVAAGRESLAGTVSTLSHELRTPLASMKSSLGLVIDGETGELNPEQHHFLAMTMRNINRLERLVSDLLEVSHGGVPANGNETTIADLGPALRDAVQMQAVAATAAGLDFDTSGLPASLQAHVDPDRLSQILANIIGNAIKYTPTGGLVRVWVELASESGSDRFAPLAGWLVEQLGLVLNTFTLVVEDSGPGLSEAEQERIFEPWFRGERQESGSIPGAGLGLSITRSLVEAYGGRIWLLSAPGQGTAVRVALPCDPDSERLLKAARSLDTGLARDPLGQLALWDVRAGDPTASEDPVAIVTAFQKARPDLAVRALASPVAGVVGAVVTDPDAWCRGWREYDGKGTLGRASRWLFRSGNVSQVNKESMEPLVGRNP